MLLPLAVTFKPNVCGKLSSNVSPSSNSLKVCKSIKSVRSPSLLIFPSNASLYWLSLIVNQVAIEAADVLASFPLLSA